MAGNKTLNAAAHAKNDKFYTQLTDIENELYHYKNFFGGKTVLCNCDDPFESHFFKYFAANFNALKLKKLIATSYADSSIAGLEINIFPDGKTAYMIEITELKDWNGDGRENLDDVEFAIRNKIYLAMPLTGDEKFCAGDFRSKELVDLLKQSDVVVTNPPFSLFREFVAQLIEHDKKFLIIGNLNAVTYKEIFPLIMQNKIWLGYGFRGGDPHFRVPDDYEEKNMRFWIDDDGKHWRSLGNLHWFTNIETPKRFKNISLQEKFSPEKYPRYDNYDAIEVSKTAKIPADYFGVMGVPITFLDKYNPNQFEIVGKIDSGPIGKYNLANPVIDGVNKYKRIAIRRTFGGA